MKEASFHMVITSYQLIIQDIKYFQRIKWHYMILDEAQAIKSSSRYTLYLLCSTSFREIYFSSFGSLVTQFAL